MATDPLMQKSWSDSHLTEPLAVIRITPERRGPPTISEMTESVGRSVNAC